MTRRHPQRFKLPLLQGETPAHVRCGKCSLCTTGIGRSRDPEATDCWADYLDLLLPVKKQQP